MGAEFLKRMGDCDVLLHVLRGFPNEDVSHFHETIDPIRDMNVLNQEIMMKVGA